MKTNTLNLVILEIAHTSGTTVVSPLYLPGVAQFDVEPGRLATRVYEAMYKDWLRTGSYDFLLQYISGKEIQFQQIDIFFEASKEQKFPDLHLNFDLFYLQNHEEKYIGFVPVLQIESSGDTLEELNQNIKDNIQLEFMRGKRLRSVASILTTQWFNNLKLHPIPKEFQFYTLAEQDENRKRNEEKLLPEVAQRLQVTQQELYGLEDEFEQLVTTMKSRHRNSILVIGGSGKGKTALIREFCFRKAKEGLHTVAIWEISAAQLIHRLSALGSWEEYLGDICRELRKSGDILYVTNLADLFEVGQYVGNNMSMADYLRDYIARGEIVLLSECTEEEAARIELRAPGYLPLFTNIKIGELSTQKILTIVSGKIQQWAKKKRSTIKEEAIVEIVRLQQWFTPYSELPGKTIHFLNATLADKGEKEPKVIDKPVIYRRFCEETGMPEFMVNPEVTLDFAQMQDFFHKNIYGQEEAIQTVLDVIVAIKAAIIRRGKPLTSLLFVGPTGVGKTEMAKVLAHFMFGNRDKMLRFDMSEYADLQSIMRLTGDNYGGEGLLTSAVRQEPFSVILFDELEKVHPAFYDLLLQILGEGRLTDARGRVADFCSTIIIMTSNIGSRSFQTGTIGFVETSQEREAAVEHFTTEVQAYFRPELFNRLDRVIAFAPLEKAVVRKIVDREIHLIQRREGIRGRNVQVTIDKDVLDYLGKKGYNSAYGARFLQRTLQEELVLPLAQRLNQYTYAISLDIVASLDDTPQIHWQFTPREDINITQQSISETKELNVLDFIQEVTQKRRQAGVIENGAYYTKFLSRLDQLERKLKNLKRKKREKEFWQIEQQQKEYYRLKELERKFSEVFAQIEEIDSENFLLINSLHENQTTLYQQYLTWQKEFHLLKVELVKRENPEFITCTIGIYGNIGFLNKFYEIYAKIAGNIQARLTLLKVWHDPEKEEYHKKRLEEKITEPWNEVGYLLEFYGNLPYLYLRREGGVHIWTTDKGTTHKYMLSVLPVKAKAFKIPGGIHRKSIFNNKKMRRLYQNKKLEDETYQLQLNTKDFAQTLLETLNKQFLQQIDGYLLN